ncbi:MAG: hypothetical protein ACUVRR_04075 [Candidatus Fervidibacter sp.]|uniref:hypothetical protein n=1 Tax=Candidatus Fervidibacter sp. TaxID=3100871 RepID=UPI00404AA41D
MKPEPKSVVGLRKEEAVRVLEAMGIKVSVKMTKPPQQLRKEPVSWRVITQRETDEGIELVLTPELIDWLTPSASENK